MLTGPKSDPSYFEGEYVTFEMYGEAKKTVIWRVMSKRGGWLGDVKWFSRWRKYSFFPAPHCVFEQVCLRDIAEFVEERTKEHKTGI